MPRVKPDPRTPTDKPNVVDSKHITLKEPPKEFKPMNPPKIIAPTPPPDQKSERQKQAEQEMLGIIDPKPKPSEGIKTMESIETLKAALHAGTLPSALSHLKRYVDPDKAFAEGMEVGRKDARNRSVEFGGNTEAMRQRMEAAKDSADRSLAAIIDTANFARIHDTQGGLYQTISETGFLWGAASELKEMMKPPPKSDPSTSVTPTESPETAAEKYFEAQKKASLGKYGEMTWNQTMISDSAIEIENAHDEYQQKFWTKVHQLALGIKSEVDSSVQERKDREDRTVFFSSWWIIIPLGVGAVAVIANKIWGFF
jgi:hypothetical protein